MSLLVAAGVAGLACSSNAPPPPLAELPLLPYVGRLVTLEVGVGRDTLPFLLDTGGGETLITPAVATALGCTPQGRSVGFRMSGERVEFAHCPDVTLFLGGIEFPHPTVGVFDIRSLLPPDWPSLGGLISLQTFRDQPVTLQLAEGSLILESAASLAWRVKWMSRLVSRLATGPDGGSLTMFFQMVWPAPGWYLFDSANLDVVRVDAHLDVGNVPERADGTREGRVQFDGLSPVDARWRVADIIYDGALSEAFLRKWRITLDLSNGAGAAWAMGAPPVDGS